MIVRLFLAFTVTTSVELYLLMTVGAAIGPLTTVLIILCTGALGAWLAKREGISVVTNLMTDLGKGIPPTTGLAEAVLVLAGSLFLLTPGFLTDLAGFAFLVPITRRQLAPILVNWVGANVKFKAFNGDDLRGATTTHSSEPKDPKELPFDHPIA